MYVDMSRTRPMDVDMYSPSPRSKGFFKIVVLDKSRTSQRQKKNFIYSLVLWVSKD